MPKLKKKLKSAEPSLPAPSVDQTKVAALIDKIRVGMPTVTQMRTQPLGILRKHLEWQRRARPHINELERLIGKPVSLEKYRPS